MELSVKRSLVVFFILLTLLSPSTLLAQVTPQQRTARPAPAPTATTPATARLPEAKLISQVLPNGLEVIVLEDHSIPLVTVELAVKNGSYTEPPELNGLSHLYEHMFFKANCAYIQRASYLGMIDQLGILSNASTREEIVNYYSHTTSPNIRAALLSLRDSARCPLFREEDLEQE